MKSFAFIITFLLNFLDLINRSLPEALSKRVKQVLQSKTNHTHLDYAVTIEDVSNSKSDKDGKKCVDKIEMVEETEYEHRTECDHSYDRYLPILLSQITSIIPHVLILITHLPKILTKIDI